MSTQYNEHLVENSHHGLQTFSLASTTHREYFTPALSREFYPSEHTVPMYKKDPPSMPRFSRMVSLPMHKHPIWGEVNQIHQQSVGWESGEMTLVMRWRIRRVAVFRLGRFWEVCVGSKGFHSHRTVKFPIFLGLNYAQRKMFYSSLIFFSSFGLFIVVPIVFICI
jgi:hypothetical protein